MRLILFLTFVGLTFSCSTSKPVPSQNSSKRLPECWHSMRVHVSNSDGCIVLDETINLENLTRCLYATDTMTPELCIELLGKSHELDTVAYLAEPGWPISHPDTIIVFKYCIGTKSQFDRYVVNFNLSTGSLFSVETEPSGH